MDDDDNDDEYISCKVVLLGEAGLEKQVLYQDMYIIHFQKFL